MKQRTITVSTLFFAGLGGLFVPFVDAAEKPNFVIILTVRWLGQVYRRNHYLFRISEPQQPEGWKRRRKFLGFENSATRLMKNANEMLDINRSPHGGNERSFIPHC